MKKFPEGELVRVKSSSRVQFVDSKLVVRSVGNTKNSLIAMALEDRLTDSARTLVWLVTRQERCIVSDDDIEPM